ncbi:MAG: tetratricopeptide repeat protein [Thermoflexales bacterium]|nr:tetratricopeptide repeat protein [Thermoflexales bacterium]
MTMSSDVSKGVELARQRCRAGDLQTARQLIEDVLRTEPSNVDALLLAAEVYRLGGNLQLASKVYARVGQLDPQRPEAPAGLALLYYEQGQAERCEQCLDATLDLDPVYLRRRYYSHMAAARQSGGKGDKMVDFYARIAAAYQRLIERYPASPLLAFNLARVLFALGEPELAAEAYGRCLHVDPDMTEAYAGMAQVSLVLERYEDAVGWCKLLEGRTWAVTGGDPDDPDWMSTRAADGELSLGQAYLVQAKAHLWMGQFEETGQAIRRAVEMEPWNSAEWYADFLEEHIKLGRALMDNKQLPEAIQVLESGRDVAERLEYHRLFLWLAQAYAAQAAACREAKDEAQAKSYAARAREILAKPPVPVPPDARAAWDKLKERVSAEDSSGLFGFLRR